MIGVPVEPFTFDRFVMAMIDNGLITVGCLLTLHGCTEFEVRQMSVSS